MCGIAAVFGSVTADPELLIKTMLSRIRHRGFSQDEIWASSAVALGANRLQIVAPDEGMQPAANESRTVLAVLNGEIYNYLELAQQLQVRGHRFSSKCDTEVLVHAYEEWGADMFDHFRGMFACILYDAVSQQVLLARDPAGVKPLYIGYGPDGSFYAASEAKALVGLASSATLLPPGHMHDGIKAEKYALSKYIGAYTSYDDAAARLRELITDAIVVRLPEGLPFAVFLSGGIDSSLILALAAAVRRDVIGITFGLPGSLEIERARQFCAQLGVRHEVIELSFEALMLNYADVIRHLESFEPNLVRASLISYVLCERARQLGLRVALAGEGADELFGGYQDFQHLQGEQLESQLSAFSNDLHRTQLLRWDKMGMAHTVEVRTPYMDRYVIDFARALPANFKVRFSPEGASTAKAILREAAKNILEDPIRERVKIPMDDGVCAPGAKQWTSLLSAHFESLPTPFLSESVCKRFAIADKEEGVNLETLLSTLPQDFISESRITVREKII